MKGWVSIKDRLPEEGKRVLVFNPSGKYMYVWGSIQIGEWLDRPDTECGSFWTVAGTSGGPNYKEYIPTHWTELPQPPIEVEK